MNGYKRIDADELAKVLLIAHEIAKSNESYQTDADLAIFTFCKRHDVTLPVWAVQQAHVAITAEFKW